MSGPVTVPLLDPVKDASGALVTTQTIPLGPAASQVAIKQLGVNGGGFFNANSAHPFENPYAVFQLCRNHRNPPHPDLHSAIRSGRWSGPGRKGVSILIAMTLIFLPLLGLAIWSELGGNPAFAGWESTRTHRSPAGWQHGRKGGAVRYHVLGALLRCYHIRILRGGQFDARLVHAAGRVCPALHDAVRGSGVRR